LVLTHHSQIQTTIPNQTDYHIHLEFLNIVIIIKLWFSAAFYPTITSSFLEIDGSRCPAIAARLSPLFLKELLVKTLMHRTPSTILATSRNKANHLSSPHCFEQVRKYNTRTNPLPLLHTSEKDPFPLLHTSERVIRVSRYGKPHTTLNSTHNMNQRKIILATCKSRYLR